MVTQNRLSTLEYTLPRSPSGKYSLVFSTQEICRGKKLPDSTLLGSWSSLAPWLCACLLTRCKCCCCSVTRCVWLFATPLAAARQPSPSFTISWSLLRFMSIESVMPSNHLIPYHPLLLLPSIFPSIRVFSNESALRIRWPKYWSCILPGVSKL